MISALIQQHTYTGFRYLHYFLCGQSVEMEQERN